MEWLILTVCQSIKGYFILVGKEIAFIVYLYLNTWVVFSQKNFLNIDIWYQVFQLNTNYLITVLWAQSAEAGEYTNCISAEG